MGGVPARSAFTAVFRTAATDGTGDLGPMLPPGGRPPGRVRRHGTASRVTMRRRGERGETLAEVLVSTTLLGIIGIGIIGAIAAVLISTDIDRRVSAGETVLRSYVAAIEDTKYVDCAGTDAYGSGNIGYPPPRNFTAEVANVQYLVPPAPDARPVLSTTTVPLQFGDSCPDPDPGVQLIDVKVTSTGSRQTTERISFVKRQSEASP